MGQTAFFEWFMDPEPGPWRLKKGVCPYFPPSY